MVKGYLDRETLSTADLLQTGSIAQLLLIDSANAATGNLHTHKSVQNQIRCISELVSDMCLTVLEG